MARTWGCLLVLLAFVSLAYAARSNICLQSGSTRYKPLQLYPKDCPSNATNCMAAVYKYNAAQFKSNGPSTLMPGANGARESFVYLAQDELDQLTAVVITATTYKNNRINTTMEMDGASPADLIVQDDPPTYPVEDTWSWDSSTNRGNFLWLLQPTYTDGVVVGHFKMIDNYCFRVMFVPNYDGAIAKVHMLSGDVAKPVKVVSKDLTKTSGFFEFCSYPRALISKTDASCGTAGSASAESLSGNATYEWKKDGVTVGTTSTIENLSAGTYTVTVTVNGCDHTRDVRIESAGSTLSFTHSVVDATKTKNGKITLAISGGNSPYSITWKNSAGTVIANDVTTVNVPAGSYSVVVSDGCATQTRSFTVGGPDSCPAGTRVDGDDCVPCLAGTYSTGVDSATCNVCPPGSQNNVSGSTNCTTCPRNTVSDGGSKACTDCPPNTYTGISGNAICTPCKLGTVRPSGATSCTPCAAGTSRCATSSSCQPCPAGTFSSSAGASSCEMCDPGTFSAEGSTSCTTCPADTYAGANASSCTACENGQTAAAGSTTMTACLV